MTNKINIVLYEITACSKSPLIPILNYKFLIAEFLASILNFN